MHALNLDSDLFFKSFVTMLAIFDPLGGVPVFLALTNDLAERQRKRAALQAVGVAAAVVIVFALFGQPILKALGISVEALQVAGGLLLVLVALELLRPEGEESRTVRRGNVALVPLGTPLLAGPGAIAATMLYMRRAVDFGGTLSVVGALLVALLVVGIALRYSSAIAKVLKNDGIDLVSRVMGLLLTAIAVQLVATGIASWIHHGI
ncbi:MAG: multiple antibiotic resistance protein [Actinomycetota bacterium]|nr:multiple antibiotic resistance protein [Actinomycetota bacterium]